MASNETRSIPRFAAIFIAVVTYCLVFTDAVIPDFIKVCHSNDPKVAICINNSIEEIRPRLVDGIPELNVPPIEPLSLNEIKLARGPDGAKIEAAIKNIAVRGPSDFVIQSLQTDIANNQFDFKVLLPRLTFKGDYTMNMRILLLSIQGRGVITGNLTNYKADVRMKGDKIEKNGKKYLKMRKMKTLLDVGDVSVHLTNLFNGDPILGPATNRIINQNSKIFLEEIQPALENSISEVFTEIANRITLKFSYDELFP